MCASPYMGLVPPLTSLERLMDALQFLLRMKTKGLTTYITKIYQNLVVVQSSSRKLARIGTCADSTASCVRAQSVQRPVLEIWPCMSEGTSRLGLSTFR